MTDKPSTPATPDPTNHNVDLDRIGRDSVRASALVLPGTAIELVVRMGTLVLMARLLEPKDFGLFAMAMTPVAILLVLGRFGFPTAVVQRPDLHNEDASHLFWINLKITAALTVVSVSATPLFALYFGKWELIPLAWAGAGSCFLTGVTVIHVGLLRRRMWFGTIASANVISSLGGAAVGIGLALAGFGVWALMLQHVAVQFLEAAVRWFGCRWYPLGRTKLKKRSMAVSELLRFGRHVLGARILEHAVAQLPPMLIGGISTDRFVGFYRNAERWAMMPVTEMLRPIRGVAVGGISRLRETTVGNRLYARSIILVVLSAVLPLLTVMFLYAHNVVLLVLGQQWSEATPLLRILLLGAIASSLMRVSNWYFLAEGQTAWLLKWSAGRAALAAVGMLIGTWWGPEGVAIGFSIAMWCWLPATLSILVRCTPFGWKDVMATMGRPLLACGVAATVLAILSSRDPSSSFPIPGLVPFLVAVVTYFLAWLAPSGGVRELNLAWNTARDRLTHRSG